MKERIEIKTMESFFTSPFAIGPSLFRDLLLTLLLAWLASPADASGLKGQCADCHTMHNSEQGAPVAKEGLGGNISATPIQNLLRMDCVACHAQGAGEMVVTLSGGSKVPQVYHDDPSGDLAAGNFAYISGTKGGHEGTSGSRKGHNVVDLVAADTELWHPPGHRHRNAEDGTLYFDVTKFTCAGQKGCHGMRSQVLETGNYFIGEDSTYRIGLSALSGRESNEKSFSGAHHRNYDGLKLGRYHPNFADDPLVHSYRFIPDLKGYGNENDRWRNIDSENHNEYHGGWFNEITKNYDFGGNSRCDVCHQNGTGSTTSRIRVLNRTMTGFCITCHGNFHSAGVTSGASGAFLRHPSDYVIPDRDEYAGYTTYSTTAPVARPAAFFSETMSASAEVNQDEDLVMCLSCHMSHASPYDGMLRFNYITLTSGMRAGDGNATHANKGCLACHTAKGGAPPAQVP